MKTPIYNTFEEKDKFFSLNERIETEEALDQLISDFISKEKDYLFRGINTACYKLFSSSQVQWMLADAQNKDYDINDYRNFIINCIKKTRNIESVKRYITNNKIPDNDLFILAMMQHYGMPSPMLDFSHSILGSLFFACDNCDMNLSESRTQLSDYVSLYVISKKIDWVNCSVQKVMLTGAENLNRMLLENKTFKAGLVDTKAVEYEYRYLPYIKFKDSNFIAIEDNPDTNLKISIPALNFNCEYQIINDRILSQQGMFIANNTVDKPLVELMNEWCKDRYFHCYNIHKNLIGYLKESVLIKNGITEEMIYCRADDESNELDKAFTELKNEVKDFFSSLSLKYKVKLGKPTNE